MGINKKKLNRSISLEAEMQNPFRKNRAKEIIKIVRRIRKGSYRLIIRREKSQDEFKENFADFMIGNLENDFDQFYEEEMEKIIFHYKNKLKPK